MLGNHLVYERMTFCLPLSTVFLKEKARICFLKLSTNTATQAREIFESATNTCNYSANDVGVQTKFERELHKFVAEKNIQESALFMTRTLLLLIWLPLMFLCETLRHVGRCFGRRAIEGYCSQRYNGDHNRWIHRLVASSQQEMGITPLAENSIRLATNAELRRMGRK